MWLKLSGDRPQKGEAELLRDAALERLRASLRQQLQEEAERQALRAQWPRQVCQLKGKLSDMLVGCELLAWTLGTCVGLKG